MARRNDDIHFGSDSFLDVMANVVGILVILIVIVGLRVVRGPSAEAASTLAKQQAHLEDIPILPTLADDPPPAPVQAPVVVVRKKKERKVVERPKPPEFPPRPPAELVDAATQAAEQLASLKQQFTELQGTAVAAANRRGQLNNDLANLRQSISTENQALSVEAEKLIRLQRDTEGTVAQLDVLEDQLTDAEAAPEETQELKHRMTPVARVVRGEELHFRLAGDRVSHVPIDALALRLKDYLMRHRDAIIKLERYEGTVGPSDGYRMKYLVEKQAPGLLEELKQGGSVARYDVTSWVIEPDVNVKEETAEEALSPHSRFVEALRLAGPRTTLTFWVYPDSFRLHRKLLEAVHEYGLEVAVRPLPEGVPITGSRNGSRSFAQ